jgi:MFS family permease
VTESNTQRTRTGERRPLAELFFGRYRRQLLQVLILMTGVWLANNMVSAVMPQLLGSHLQLSGSAVSAVAAINSLSLVVAFQVYGALSQRTGRRRFYLWYGAVMAVIGSALYAVLMTADVGPLEVTVLACAVGWTVQGSFGPVAAYLTERFPSRVRASGFGTGYSLALVLPAFYPVYLAGLGAVMPSYLAPVVLIVIAGALVSIGGALGPETRDADLRR